MIKRSENSPNESFDPERPYAQLGRLIRNLRLRKGLSQSDLAHAIALHPSYLSRMEHGERRPSPGVLKKMSEVLDYALSDLLVVSKLIDEDFAETAEVAEKGTILSEIDQLKRQLAQISGERYERYREAPPVARSTGIRAIPVFDRVPAGVSLPEARGTYQSMPALMLTEDELEHVPQAFALVVTGDSMVDAGILEGDIVVVSPSTKIKDGDTVVVALGDHDVSLKIVYFEGNKVLLQAANRNYRSLLLRYPEEVEILGKVVLVRRKLA